jgi:hypothetical protein
MVRRRAIDEIFERGLDLAIAHSEKLSYDLSVIKLY